jgi:hypothetical protein
VTIALDDPMRVSRDPQTADPSFWAFAAVFAAAVGLGCGLIVVIRRRMRQARGSDHESVGQ